MAEPTGSPRNSTTAPERPVGSRRASTNPEPNGPRATLAKVIPRRARVSWWLGIVFALALALLVMPSLTAERWLASLGAGKVIDQHVATLTVRVPAFAGYNTADRHIGNGGIVIARGQLADSADEANVKAIAEATPRGALPYLAVFLLTFVLGAIFSHHMRRSTRGRLVRVQVVSMALIVVLAAVVKTMLLITATSVLVVPVAVLALVPTMVLDRIVGLATGILAALVIALLGPFDVGVAILMLVQAAVAGLVVAEQPKDRWRAALTTGAVTTLFTASTYFLLTYLTTGHSPVLRDPLHSAWFAAALGPAIATMIAVPLVPLYQLLVGEITRSKLVDLEDLSNPLLRQIAEKAPGTWQHSLMMANMAEIAANAIGASGRLVRVGAYYHDLGKSLQPKYFIENLEPGETSPHDQLPPEVSCDAIFAHVTEGIVTARKAGLHERIVDFMHMHHGNGVLEYFWGKTKDQGNPKSLTVENFRYPGHPPQSRETAILAICDAVEAASRTLKKPDATSIDSLVQRIVYGKLHLGQLDESGLSMSDLRRINDSLRETIRHANHGRIEYPWQKAAQDASASVNAEPPSSTGPRLDSLDRPGRRETSAKPTAAPPTTTDAPDRSGASNPGGAAALAETADIRPKTTDELALVATAPALIREVQPARKTGTHRIVEPPGSAVTPTTRLRAPTNAPAANRSQAPSRPPIEPQDLARASSTPRASEPERSHVPAHLPPESIASYGRSDASPELVTPAMFGDGPHGARKRAATLPPMVPRRAPTIPPLSAPSLHAPTIPPLAARSAGPPPAIDLENAVTHPPPLRQVPSTPPEPRPSGARPPAVVVIDDEARPTEQQRAVSTPPDEVPEDDEMPEIEIQRVSSPSLSDETRSTDAHRGGSPAVDDAGRTEPTMSRFDMPLQAPPSTYPGMQLPRPPQRGTSLAERIDAALDSRDEWSTDTPVVAPSRAELRALTGNPDPTRQQSFDELEALHRAAAEIAETSEPELLPHRRAPHPTAEVDPDDIEAAIELAPPARRAPSSIAVAKPSPKKP